MSKFIDFFTEALSIVLIGDFAPQEEDLNAEKSLVPINILIADFIFFMSIFFCINHTLLFIREGFPILLRIIYL